MVYSTNLSPLSLLFAKAAYAAIARSIIVNVFNFVSQMRRWRWTWVALILLLSACSTPTPPRELAPNGQIVQKAIALQLNQTQQKIADRLNASSPQIQLNQITVKQIEPIFVDKLATYHLKGTYTLIIKLPRQQVTQNNAFDIYIQRQAQGKTWRLLKREANQWTSYLIQ